MKNEITGSSKEMMNANMAAENTPGAIAGRVTCRNAAKRLAPQDNAGEFETGVEAVERGQHGEDDERHGERAVRQDEREQRADQAQAVEHQEQGDGHGDGRHDHRAHDEQLDHRPARDPAAHQCKSDHGAGGGGDEGGENADL